MGLVLWGRVHVWVFILKEEKSSFGEREVMLCRGRWAEEAPGWGDLGKGRVWLKTHGQPGSLLR